MQSQIRLIPNSKIGKGIIHILNSAKKIFVLVSPYCDFLKWKEFTDAVEYCINRGIEITLFTRDSKDVYENGSISYLIENGVQVYLINKLHAKLYMNEKEAVITSLNLLFSSVFYSKEVGCFITDTAIVDKLYKNYFERFEKIGKYISYHIKFSFVFNSSVKELRDYFPDLIIDD